MHFASPWSTMELRLHFLLYSIWKCSSSCLLLDLENFSQGFGTCKLAIMPLLNFWQKHSIKNYYQLNQSYRCNYSSAPPLSPLFCVFYGVVVVVAVVVAVAVVMAKSVLFVSLLAAG